MVLKMRMKTQEMIVKTDNPWAQLKTDDARRVKAFSKYDFFWVKPEAGVPGLMLRLLEKPDPLPRLPKLKNLTANFRGVSARYAFVITLKDLSQIDVFETLCRDVVEAGESAENIYDCLLYTSPSPRDS